MQSVANDNHQDVFSYFLFAHKVLVVYYAHLVVLTLLRVLYLAPLQLVELGLEIGEKFIHPPSKPIQEVLANVVFEHYILGVHIPIHLQVVLEF